LPFPRRLSRSCSLLCNPRGIGWSHSIPSAVIPKTFPVSRRNFVLYRLLRIFILVLVLDAGFTLQAIHPLLNALARAENCSKLRMRDQPYSIRCMMIGIFGVSGYAGLMIQSDVISVLFVGSGFSEPRDWPDLFGPLRGCWTVRRFWGKTWHQALRPLFVAYGQYTSRKIGFTSMSFAETWTMFVIAFVLSAAIHCGGDYMLTSTITISHKFYLSQPIGIALETLVWNASASWQPHTTLRRAIGYAWVVLWFSWSTIDMVDGLVCEGLMRDRPSFSVVRPLIECIWKGP